VICAGGLGPTVDDMTRAAVAAATNLPLEQRPGLLAELRGYFARAGRRMAANNELQTWVPEGALVLPNPRGTAPGFIVHTDGRLVAAMPGVPRAVIRGGRWDGTDVVSKSGAFGQVRLLRRLVTADTLLNEELGG